MRAIRRGEKVKGRFIKALKKVGSVLLVTIIVLSALPYMLPLKPLTGDPAELLTLPG